MKEVLNIPSVLEGNIWYHSRNKFLRAMHRHDELEVNLVVRGTARYLLANRHYDLCPGMQIWLFPEQDHLLLDESPDYEMWIVVFRPSLLKRMCQTPETSLLLETNPTALLCRRLQGEHAERLALLYHGLGQEVASDVHCFNAGLGYTLLSAWAAHQAASQAHGRDVHPAVEAAVRLLREAAPEQVLGVEEVAEQCGLSASRLSHLFRQQIGVSLVDFRNRLRIEQFVRLYAGGNRLNIAEAALAAGFGSYAQFHRVCRHHLGCTPLEYRRRLTKLETIQPLY